MGDSTLDIFGPQDDPFGGRNSLKIAGLPRGSGGRPRAPAAFPPLPPEEAEPAKQGLLNRTISGLHYVGSTLDKAFGARALRGLAAGKPHELLSAIPGSDTFGLTKPEDAVSMDDLLTKHYHVFKPNDPTKWEFRDFAVPAMEIAADPGTWISPFGAMNKFGKLASGAGHTEGWTRKMLTEGFTHLAPELKAAGHTPEMIADLVNRGGRVASQDLIDAAAAKGMKLEAGTPLRGALGVGLPFREATTAFGSGKRAQALAGLQDTAAGKIAAAPGIRSLLPLFDPDRMRAVDPRVGAAARRSGVPAREAMRSTTWAGAYDLSTRLDALMKNHTAIPGVENEALRVIRGAAEGSPTFADPARWQADLMRRHGTATVPGQTLATGVTDPHAVANHVLGNWGELQDMGQAIRKFGEDIHVHSQDAGLNSTGLDDLFAHYAARRYIAAAPNFGGTAIGRQFPTMHGSNMQRKTPLSNVPGATPQLDEWAINPALAGPARPGRLSDADIEAHLLSQMTHLNTLSGSPMAAADLAQKAKEVRGWLPSVPQEHYTHGIPYFNTDIIGDYAMRGDRHAKVAGAAASIYDAAGGMARPTAEFLAANEKHVKLGDLMSSQGPAGLVTATREARFAPHEQAAILGRGFPNIATARAATDPAHPMNALLAGLDPGLAHRLQHGEWHGAGMRMWEKMAPQGFGPVALAQTRPGAPVASKLPYWQERLNEHALSQADADQLTRHLQGWVAPTEMKPILGPLAGAHQLFKNAVYPLWPASHARNAASAVWNNFLHGTGFGDYRDAVSIMRKGRAIDPSRYAHTLGMTPEQAAHALNQGGYADAKIYSGVSSYDERVGGRGLQDERLTRGLAGQERLVPPAPGVHPPLAATLAKGGWQNLNPLAQEGLGGGWIDKLLRTGRTTPRTEDAFAPLVLGRRAGTGIEDTVRMANYLGNLRRGMNSSKAGQLTRDIHFDYSNLTPFESNVMKQAIPFYTFMRNNLPYQANMAMTRPGSVSPVLHAMQATNPNQPWVPEYMASGASIPIGQEHDGTQRYLGSLGSPLEEAAGRFKFKNYELPWGQKVNLPAPLATLAAFAGEGSPYFKAPLEAMTNTQFKTGRPLDELKSNRLVSLNGLMPDEYARPLSQVVSNSPLARVFSSLQTAVDDRKGPGAKATNLLTGMRLHDEDLGRQRNAIMRSEIDQMLKADPRVSEFTNFNVRPEIRSAVPADLDRRMRLLKTLQREAKAYHQAKADREKLKALYGGVIPSGL